VNDTKRKLEDRGSTTAHLLELAKNTIDAVQTRLFLKQHNHEGYRNSQKQSIAAADSKLAAYLTSPCKDKVSPLVHLDYASTHFNNIHNRHTQATCAPEVHDDIVTELLMDAHDTTIDTTRRLITIWSTTIKKQFLRFVNPQQKDQIQKGSVKVEQIRKLNWHQYLQKNDNNC
jgi:hypothetical protein